MNLSGLSFGIYPLSVAGTPFGVAEGPADDYEKIRIALKDLRGESKRLSPRNYLIYSEEWEGKMFSLAARYLDAGLLGDLVLGCGDWTKAQNLDMELDKWLSFIKKVINQYGSHLSSVQITNEPNLSFMEGSKPYIIQALIEGVVQAKRETEKLNLPVKIGFGSVPDGPMAVPRFWESLKSSGGSRLIEATDFIGHNFYVDVFDDRPLNMEEVQASVKSILGRLRNKDFRAAGIPDSIPIRVTENGWPTGRNPVANIERSYESQAAVLEIVIKTIHQLRQEPNITHYELFGLRDADSSKDDLFHQFGILRDDYSPKPAYSTFKKLIQELGE